ncbi:MAG: hypothetical protein HY919_02950 [Elusimicrobia bacterium]|nr:hypothetical protein [Elusimicrobiota bacterium]
MNEIIFEQLGNIEGKIDGILMRLDKINGTLQKHEQDIVNFKLNKSFFLGASKVVFFIIGLIGAALGFTLPLFFKFLF